MLKTSWSIEAESSTIDDDLGLRVEVGAGLDQQLLDLVEVLLGIGGHRRRILESGAVLSRRSSAS